MVKCADNTLYTGITTDLDRRVSEHNSWVLWAKYTKMRQPVELVFSMDAENRSEASKEEIRIKRLSRTKKLELISDYNE